MVVHHSLDEDDDKSKFVSADHKTFVRSKSEEYSRQIQKLQEDYLYPMKEDLSEWINRILGSQAPEDDREKEDSYYLTPENFIDKLDNGVIICKVAKVIESQCDLTDIVIDRIKRELTMKNNMISNGHHNKLSLNNAANSSSHNNNNNLNNNTMINNRSVVQQQSKSRIPVKNVRVSI